MSKLQDFKRLNTRPASVVELGGFRPTRDPLATHFGMRPMAAPGEIWPESDGQPMLFVCQLNLTAAPFVPPLLAGIQLITFFIESADAVPEMPENGQDWRLLTYSSLDGLAPLTPPDHAPKLKKSFECSWTAADDHPVFEDPDRQSVKGFDASEVELDNLARTKLGGYPSLIQAEPWWSLEDHPAQPVYCLQINSEEKAGLVFADAGAVYLARGTAEGHRDQWFLDCQFY